MSQIQEALQVIMDGGVIAYPTEAVFGLGCDPQNDSAVQRILDLKQRPVSKGLILVTSSLEYLKGYIDTTDIDMSDILSTWPGPSTWLLPVGELTPSWISGEHTTVAVRVSYHPVIQSFGAEFKHPIVSTSANPCGQSPALNMSQVIDYFPQGVDYIVDLALGNSRQPTSIRDAKTKRIVRS